MDIQAEKSLLIKQLQQIDDVELINTLKSLMQYALGKQGSENYTLDEYNHEIELAEEEIKKGEVISHSDLIKI